MQEARPRFSFDLGPVSPGHFLHVIVKNYLKINHKMHGVLIDIVG